MSALEVVAGRETSGPEIYPISSRDRLDSHFFLQWNLKRWRGSDFRKKAYKDPEVGFYGFELFCLSQDETPVGTLPSDDEGLAFLLHLSLEKWKSLRERKITPLHGWRLVRCDNGEIRYAHPVVTEVAQEALGGRSDLMAKREADRERKRLEALPGKMLRAGAPKGMAEDEGFVLQFDQFLIENFDAAGQRRPAMIRQALEAFSLAREGLDWRAQMGG